MSKIQITDSKGQVTTLPIEDGLSLMEHLTDAGYDEVQAICGGCCSCATCHVHIVKPAGEIYPAEENEELLLEMADHYDRSKSRLSCQIELTDEHDGLQVSLIGSEL